MAQSDIATVLLSKLLSYNNLTIEQAREIPEYYNKYTWTPQQEQEWIEWAVATLRKKKRWGLKMCQTEVAMFNLMYGFRTKPNEATVHEKNQQLPL